MISTVKVIVMCFKSGALLGNCGGWWDWTWKVWVGELGHGWSGLEGWRGEGFNA